LLLSIKADGGSWKQITAAACGGNRDTNPALASLAQGDEPQKTADLITMFMLEKRYPGTDRAVAVLRQHLSDFHKIALILALAEQTRIPPRQILYLYQNEKKSFSQIAHEHGLTPEEVGKAVLDNP
jgi:hypothetical protein